QQHLAAFAGRRLEPLRQRFLRRLHRAVAVLGCRPRHLGDRLAGRGIQHLHRLAARRVDPLASDEVLVPFNRDAHAFLLESEWFRAYTVVISALWAAARDRAVERM